MQPIDWTLIALALLLILAIAIYTRRYMKSVADFMSGGRVAGRYLLAVSKGELGAPAVGFVAGFEIIAKAGFCTTWWAWINIPVGLILAISGFVYFRYRETRALTLAQFFEIRYSRAYRVFMGVLGFSAGIVNFGIIPVVEARLMTCLLGFPPSVTFLSITVPTYSLVMAVIIASTLLLTLSGGLITVMVTNCVEGILAQLLYLIVIAGLLSQIHWSHIDQVLSHQQPGHSLLNPFDSLGIKDFNVWWVLMGLFMSVYSTMAWQNQSAYNSAPLSAHEARMGNILGGWRNYGKVAFGTVLGICAFTYMHHPAFAAGSSAANAAAHQLGDARIRGQMELVLGLTHLLPPGLKGMLCIVFVMAIFGGDSAHLHSWGGVFIQDVLMPLRKRMLTPQQHIRYLRLSITGVAVFAFVFGLSFHQTEYIVMWFQMTMGLFVSGAGIAIIGGLYWKTGTTTAAWTATLTGTGLTIAGIILRQIFGDRLPVNGIQIVFFASLIAILIYIAVSYLTSKDGFNMDRMLHRGAYAEGDSAPQKLRKFTWGGLIGIDENFTVNDKWVTGSLFTWNMAWFGVFAIGTVWNWIAPWPAWVWSPFWKYAGLWLPVFLAVVTGVWFTWGGIHDMKELFRRLKSEKTDALDNGMVMGHQNLAENPGVSEPAGAMQKPLKLNVAAEVKDVS